jgi:hypothetical protein
MAEKRERDIPKKFASAYISLYQLHIFPMKVFGGGVQMLVLHDASEVDHQLQEEWVFKPNPRAAEVPYFRALGIFFGYHTSSRLS